jgi:uncharacterized protein YndB with AHSA1/START domain
MTMSNSDVTGPARADLDTGTITRTVRIQAAQDTVWRMLTDPDQVVIWWGHPMRFPDGIRAGSLGVFEWPAQSMEFPVRIDRVDPPTHFGLTWGSGSEITPDTASTVLFEVAAENPGSTLVTVTETGFLNHPDLAARRATMEENTTGWNEVLDSLVKHVEAATA